MTNLAGREYWEKGYDGLALKPAGADDPVRLWIERHAPVGPGDCIELGCYPGRYLAVFGGLGYRLHGIDQNVRATKELPEWLSSCGYDVGGFYVEDALGFSPPGGVQFDVVCSFGFVEHFTEWKTALAAHARLVKDGGTLLVAAPNFAGLVQRALHAALDSENMGRHCLGAMDPAAWAGEVAGMGFRVTYAGHFGRFAFWTDNQDTGAAQRFMLKAVNRLKTVLVKLPEGPRAYSPFCGLVAVRERA